MQTTINLIHLSREWKRRNTGRRFLFENKTPYSYHAYIHAAEDIFNYRADYHLTPGV